MCSYVIFGYVFNKVSWLYGQQGEKTLRKLWDLYGGGVTHLFSSGVGGWGGGDMIWF